MFVIQMLPPLPHCLHTSKKWFPRETRTEHGTRPVPKPARPNLNRRDLGKLVGISGRVRVLHLGFFKFQVGFGSTLIRPIPYSKPKKKIIIKKRKRQYIQSFLKKIYFLLNIVFQI